jgi:hypothetical protein
VKDDDMKSIIKNDNIDIIIKEPTGKDYFENVVVDLKIILKWMLRK